MTERERKCKCPSLPEAPPDLMIQIRQAYLLKRSPRDNVKTEFRVRDAIGSANSPRYEDFRHKSADVKLGHAPTRGEVPMPLTDEKFDQLWSASSRRIEKTRHVYYDSELDLELEFDSFHDLDLILLEVEFDTEEQMNAFDFPDVAGPEVTGNDYFDNAEIAKRITSFH